MSDNGRKRCRKSKLVPRDCADVVEEDLVLESIKEPPKKKLLLEKIKKEPDDYVPQEPSAHQFSVNVEVEDVDGSIPDEDPSDYMKYLFSLSKEDGDGEPIKDYEFVDNSLLMEKKAALEDEKNCIIDVRKLQRMLGVLHKKYPDEKEAVMHTRNQWGRVLVEKNALEMRKTQDSQLQEVLRQWSAWTLGTNCRIRESPFCYKCYICDIAWWSFTEFSAHLTMHNECKLQLEIQQQECNIVAYQGHFPNYKDVHIHGKCLKCAKTYEHHLSNRINRDAYYYCNYCQDRFQTCSSLAKHEGTCDRNPIRVLSISQNGKEFKFSDFSCQVCGTVFLSNPDLTEHMVICHKVRSDEPIFVKHKICRLCNLSYYVFNFHTCSKKNFLHECKYCYSKFQNKHILDHHLKMWDSVVRCRICDKFIMRSCMAGEHYALHSDNFEIVHRCLVCKKVKVFMSEEAMRIHRSKYHHRFDSRRLASDRIIMSKQMLQQCILDIVRKTLPKILLQKASSCPKRKQLKLTRGQPMPQVRVYAPVKPSRNDKNAENSNKPPETPNTTIAHDNIVSMRTEHMPPENNLIHVKQENAPVKPSRNDKNAEKSNKPPETPNITITHDNIVSMRTEQMPPENNLIHVKQEKNDDAINDNEHNNKEQRKDQDKDDKIVAQDEDKNDYIAAESAHSENSDIVIKTEKIDDSTVNETENLEQATAGKETKGSKDSSKIIEELNEFLDIKPDIMKIKDEKLSDAESTQGNLSSLRKISESDKVTETEIKNIFQASSTFAEEITENPEHSKVFQVSKSILEAETFKLKKEIKEEPEDKEQEDDSVLNSSTDSRKDESVTSDNSERSLLNLEPEVILRAGYRKRKVYRCSKCDFSSFHREYKEHISNHCRTSRSRELINLDMEYKCNKCQQSFPNLKRYAVHFENHGYQYMACPQCRTTFDSVTKLVGHLNSHIKNQFVRLQLLNSSDDGKCKGFQCKTCKEVETTNSSFEHWERHLVLTPEVDKKPPAEPFNIGPKGEQALKVGALKEVIASLLTEEKAHCPESKRVKVCVVCARRFERRNDCKRHLVEHLLEDALSHIVGDNNVLKCQICYEPHQKPEQYKKHMRDHASLPIYQCSICDKTFSDSSNFTKHKKIHNLKAFVCDICNKKFQAKFSLEKHMAMHMQTDPITCDRCDKVFYCESFYKRHVRQYHDKIINRYKCTLCREKFPALKEKWDHLWTVHKRRKEVADCPVCGEPFRKFADVKKHSLAEHGVSVSQSSVWSMLGRRSEEREREKWDGTGVGVKQEEDSSDDCLLIEEEMETLVVYD